MLLNEGLRFKGNAFTSAAIAIAAFINVIYKAFVNQNA